MKIRNLCQTSFALTALLLATGCASYKITPDAASISVPKATAPIPVVVGITRTEQKVSGGFPDLVPGIKKSLDESALFQTVYYPVRSSDVMDAGIELHLSAKFKADGGLFGKAFITGFFMLIPAPVVVYNHQYRAEGTLDLMKDGKTLKTYKTDAVVTVSHKLFASPERIEAEGTDTASKLLSAHLTEQLINDRAFLEKELPKTKTAASK